MLGQNTNNKFNNVSNVRLGDRSTGIPVSIEAKKRKNRELCRELCYRDASRRMNKVCLISKLKEENVKEGCLIECDVIEATEEKVNVESYQSEVIKDVVKCEGDVLKVEEIYKNEVIIREENPLKKVTREPKLKAIVDLVWSREKLNKIINNKKW